MSTPPKGDRRPGSGTASDPISPGGPAEAGSPGPEAEGPSRPQVSGAGGATTVGRRTALKILASAAALPVVSCAPPEEAPSPAGNPLASGTPSDPDLVRPVVPWERVLTPEELRTVAAVCDLILPADDRSPAASAVGVPDFIDEWVSAPYPGQRRDRVLVRGGLVWLDTESNERFGVRFVDLTLEQKTAICDDIHHLESAAPAFRAPALFFDRLRDLTVTGFYTSDEGMRDLGYVGNVALNSFDGPPPEVLQRLGLG